MKNLQTGTVPSAGARHALETCLSLHRVTGLEPGLYRYRALEHGLVPTRRAAWSPQAMAAACLEQSFVARSAVTFVWTAVRERMCFRYGERGYRYLFLDAGHACQNLYLAAEAIGCGACAIAAFSDDEVNRLLSLDGEERFALYLATVGRHAAGEER